MNYISDELYYNHYVPILNLLAKSNHPEATSCGMLNFNAYNEESKVIILSFDCFVCSKLIEMPSYNSEVEGIQIIRNHMVNHLKQKNLLPFI